MFAANSITSWEGVMASATATAAPLSDSIISVIRSSRMVSTSPWRKSVPSVAAASGPTVTGADKSLHCSSAKRQVTIFVMLAGYMSRSAFFS